MLITNTLINMKKLLLILSALLVMYSCEKEDDAKPTTYQIKNNMPSSTTTDPYLNGTLWEVKVLCYVGSDIAEQDDIIFIAPNGGTTTTMTVSNNIEKVKVSFKFLPPQSSNYNSSYNVRKYVVAYTYLEKGKNNIITIGNETLISNNP